MCYNFATFVLYLDVITLIYRENRLTSSETSLSAKNGVKLLIISGFTLFSSTVVGQKRDSFREAYRTICVGTLPTIKNNSNNRCRNPPNK